MTAQKQVEPALAHVPFATVSKSQDTSWIRWAVIARGIRTEWLRSEAAAVRKADAICQAHGSITFSDWKAARAAREQQIKALPELIEAALAVVHGWEQNLSEPVQKLRAALVKAGCL